MKQDWPLVKTVFLSTWFAFVAPQEGKIYVCKTRDIQKDLSKFEIRTKPNEPGSGALVPLRQYAKEIYNCNPTQINQIDNLGDWGESETATALFWNDKHFYKCKSCWLQKGKRIDAIVDQDKTLEIKTDSYASNSGKGYFEIDNAERPLSEYGFGDSYFQTMEAAQRKTKPGGLIALDKFAHRIENPHLYNDRKEKQ